MKRYRVRQVVKNDYDHGQQVWWTPEDGGTPQWVTVIRPPFGKRVGVVWVRLHDKKNFDGSPVEGWVEPHTVRAEKPDD